MQKVNPWGYAISSVLAFLIYFTCRRISMFLLFMFNKGVFAGTPRLLSALIVGNSGYTTRTTGVHMDGKAMYSCSFWRVKVGGASVPVAVGWLLKLGGLWAPQRSRAKAPFG